MADITYTVNQDSPENLQGFEQYSDKDLGLVDSFQINNVFDPTKHFAELHVLSLSDDLIESNYNYSGYKLLSNAQSAGQEGASILTVDPVQDVKDLGYDNGEVKLLYHFLNELYTDSKVQTQFYIEDISPDRTELRLGTLGLTPEQIIAYTGELKTKLQTQSYFAGFRLNFTNNDLLIAVNVDTVSQGLEQLVVVKLYEPLPTQYGIKDTLSLVEEVSDSIAFTVNYDILVPTQSAPTLRGANFNIEVQDEAVVPTGYYNYDELFSFPVVNANSEIFSVVNEKSINISVDYSDYANFVHFSSAQERLLNFKYKIDLIDHYRVEIAKINATTTGVVGAAGSKKYYENLLEGIVSNFDHYERFLYYESGDACWPKYNTTKPYDNLRGNEAIAIAWFTNQLQVAVAYDTNNLSSLVNTIPTYLRDDSSNTNYLTFVYMIGQHFDNLWLYSKAVTDKYDGDNRLDRGISKDLVAEALKNFGVKLYTSNKSTEELFSMFVGQGYQAGDEVINNHISATIAGTIDPIPHSSFDDYQKQIQKRIYHNLPFLLKSKGTERGLRALINCFGIPSSILSINIFGGRHTEKLPFYGDYQSTSTSLDKVRLDYTGSIVSGSTLSTDVSIIKRDKKYTDDLHQIEVGFSPTTNVDNHIIAQLGAKFNIDDYLGNPSNLYADNYAGLGKLLSDIAVQLDTYNLQDYVRLIKFFDNVIFKTVKDFIPARVNADTGIIIKPNVLTRNKAKGVELEGTRPEYSGSIDTAFITGSHGGSFRSGSQEMSTIWTDSVQTPFGLGSRDSHQHEEPKYNGEFSGSLVVVSDGEWNRDNIFKIQTPVPVSKKVYLVSTPDVTLCPFDLQVTSPVIIDNTYYQLPYDIIADITTPGITLTGAELYTSSSNMPVGDLNEYTFPTTNYTKYNVTGSKIGLADCEVSIEYQTAYCQISALQGTTTTVEKDTATDITAWFTTGVNTNTSYTASWTGNVVGITTPTSYSFPQADGTEVTITLKDNVIAGCTTNKIVTVIYTPPAYCPSNSELSAVTTNFVAGGGGYGTWYFTFNYTGPNTSSATILYRFSRDGILTPNDFYPPFELTGAFETGELLSLSTGGTASPSTSLVIEGFQCNKPVIAPYKYYANYDAESGTTSGATTACAFGPGIYEIWCNASSLSAITAGTRMYQDSHGYPYYSGGVNRWLAVGETDGGSVTKALQLSSNGTVQTTSSC